jgi:hypothetical protein
MRDGLFALPCRFLLGQAHCLSRELTDAMGGSEMTQFGRALVELNIEILCANSSQDKAGSSGLTALCRAG